MSISTRIENARQEYVNSKPSICQERARIWTESHKETESEPISLRRAKAFFSACERLPINVYEGELIIGTAGSFRRTGILTPEFSWRWVDKEMDTFQSRPQDPYSINEDQKKTLRNKIFPYWEGKSLEEFFLSRVPENTAKILIDTGIIDNDSKWRQAVGEITPDYQDVLFVKGYSGIIEDAKKQLEEIEPISIENIDKINFYRSVILVSEGIIKFSHQFAEKAEELSRVEKDSRRKEELLEIARICRKVPENPPETFHEAIQFVWFVQLGGVISENPLALNLGRFDQYIYPYYEGDIIEGRTDKARAQELIEALWIKLSEWVWTISSNTANYFAGYNQFQNLTVGGRKRDGSDGTNDLSYMCLKAAESVKTHQPGLSVRIHPDCPEKFLMAVAKLVRTGTGFPAIHNDYVGSQMLL